MPKKESQQITDAVTEVNVMVVADAPAIAMGNIYQSAAHATGLMFENSVHAQNNSFILSGAATSQGVMQIYSVDTVADAISVAQMLKANA